MGTDFRKEIGTTIDQRRDEYTKISDAIWGFAEPRFQEYESTKLQQEFLKARGFSVKADLAGVQIWTRIPPRGSRRCPSGNFLKDPHRLLIRNKIRPPDQKKKAPGPDLLSRDGCRSQGKYPSPPPAPAVSSCCSHKYSCRVIPNDP